MASPAAKRLKALLLRPEAFFRTYLRLKFGAARLTQRPPEGVMNGVLRSRGEWERASEMAKILHIPQHREPTKNWDHLAAVATVLASTDVTAKVLDAGAELYSNVLPALFLYGYSNLYAMNLGFPYASRRGPITYLPGDITRTGFGENFFDAVTCLSVIEHGVPLEGYFREMHRVLKPGGLLVTSTDYYPTPVDTKGQQAHGAPIKVFSKPEIEAALESARKAGFEPTGPVDLECTEKPVAWEAFGLQYTYVVFTLRKV